MASPSLQITCPQCSSNHQVNIRLAGRTVRCPQCDASVLVPQLSPEAPGAPEPPAEAAGGGSDSNAAPESTAAVVGNGPAAAGEDGDAHGQSETAPQPPPIIFASDPVFAPPGYHDPMGLPELPPALQLDAEDGPLRERTKRQEDELDMTPMVDVSFLLLIFFMVTASFSLQKSLEMPRQQSDAPSTNVQEVQEQELDMVTVQIDEFGSFLVLAADWERETPGKQNLTSALREAIGNRGGAVRLVIEVHEDAQLRYLVDCMDAGAVANYAEVQVTQVDGFE